MHNTKDQMMKTLKTCSMKERTPKKKTEKQIFQAKSYSRKCINNKKKCQCK